MTYIENQERHIWRQYPFYHFSGEPGSPEHTRGETNMCTIISIVNNKGGVGKSTSTGFISQLLAFLGKRVLAVDLDQQSNLSMLLGHYILDSPAVIAGTESPAEPNIADLFKYRYRTKEDVINLIYPTTIPGLDILPASKRHKQTPIILFANSSGNNNIILKKALATVKDNYDFIIIDNAPANDLLTVNSMFASDLIYVPVRLEGFSYEGLRETIDTVCYIREEHDLTSVALGGVFITQVETNTNIFKDLKGNYEEELSDKFLLTPIRKDVKVSEIETEFKPILEYCPNTNAVFDYANLLLEMNILDDAAQHLLAQSIGKE